MSPHPVFEIRARIEKAKQKSPLAAKHVELIAVAKQQPIERIVGAIEAGITHFAENRVQEAKAKWPRLLKDYPHLRLHLIGPLQTNKVQDAVALFHFIQTLDSEKLTDALAREMQEQGKPIPCLVQVNTGEEAQKAGVAPARAGALIAHARMRGVNVKGLMCVPPVGVSPAPHFGLLRELARHYGLSELSMGMSEDFEAAVRLGATQVRIGRALFGERV